jgi:hypothetical protein
MSEQILPGDGWRLLGPDEVVREGDEFINFGEWQPVFKLMIGEETTGQVRRRIPAKPKAFGVLFYQWRVINGKAVILIDMERAEFNAQQARQLADWLTRYADWREAQEPK